VPREAVRATLLEVDQDLQVTLPEDRHALHARAPLGYDWTAAIAEVRAVTGFVLEAFVVGDPARNYDALPRPAEVDAATDGQAAELAASRRASWIVAARGIGAERHELQLMLRLHELLHDDERAFDPRLGELVPFAQALRRLWTARLGAEHVQRLLADDGAASDVSARVDAWIVRDDVQAVRPPANDLRERGEFGWMRWPIAAHLAWCEVRDKAAEVAAHAGKVADGLAARPETRARYRRLQRGAAALAEAAQQFAVANHR